MPARSSRASTSRCTGAIPDPAKADGTDEQRLAAFRSVLTGLGQRIHQFLPLAERYAAQRRPVELA